MTDQLTTVIYSISSDHTLNNVADQALSLTDNNGKASKLTKPNVLAELEGLQVVAATFESPDADASELGLAIQPSSAVAALKATIAQVEPPGAKAYTPEGRQTIFYRDGYLDQANYRISYNAGAPWTKDRVAIQQNTKGLTMEELIAEQKTKAASTPEIDLSKPFPTNPITVKVSEGKPMIGEATIRIENMKTGEVQFLYMVFLDNGDIKSTWLE